MSGHSHARTIMHKKGLADAQRSKAFSRLASEITIATKEGGGDASTNARLRAVLEKAKALNMPSDNVERAIKKATGEGSENQLQEILLEAYGPGGIALLISAITDNKNRTLGEMKLILLKFNGKAVEGGAVQWLFERKGVLVLPHNGATPKEDLELTAIETGAEDVQWQSEHTLLVYTKPTELEQVKKILEEKKVAVDSFSLNWVAKEYIEISEHERENAEKLFEALDENPDVQEVYSNLKASA